MKKTLILLETIFFTLLIIIPFVYYVVGTINEYKFVMFLMDNPIIYFTFGMGWVIVVVMSMRLYQLSNLCKLYKQRM